MDNYTKNKKILEKSFNYKADMEHDACGVGLIASTNGKKSRKIIYLKCLHTCFGFPFIKNIYLVK